MKTQKPLFKDENGKEVDVHMYRSMIGSLMYLTPSCVPVLDTKVSHLYAVKRIFRYRIFKKRTKTKPKQQNRARERKEREKSKSTKKSTPTKSKVKSEAETE
ncbi:hypothetical protein Tco_1477726 [Tanacetum coccineum]